jgi:2-hydroxy-3-keto-5-methylthiopentenyl-1-phosphate phosphatase
MTAAPRPAILQLDFDGTVVEGDASVGMLTRYVGKDWGRSFDEAMVTMRGDATSSALVDTMKRGCARLSPLDIDNCLRYARVHHPVREGLAELVTTAQELGLQVDICSYGFDFYISDYLRAAGVLDPVTLRCGRTTPHGDGLALTYTGPNGEDISNNWKEAWAANYQRRGLAVAYVGDGRSDLVAALQAAAIFARDDLLSNVPPTYAGTLRSFETLSDVARGLRVLYG